MAPPLKLCSSPALESDAQRLKARRRKGTPIAAGSDRAEALKSSVLKMNSVETKGIHKPRCSSQHPWIFCCSASKFPRAHSWVHTGWDLHQLYNPKDVRSHLFHLGLALTKPKWASAGEKHDGGVSPYPLPHIMLWKTGTQNCRGAWR